MKVKNLLVLPVVVMVMVAAFAQTTYAWHPEGTIKKYVQNISTNGNKMDANSADSAVTAEHGQTLLYTITITNTAKPADKQWNDLAFIKMTDTLPEGVELVSNPSQRVISEDFKGTILTPGKSITREYKVKVVSKTDKKVIINKACFEGDSIVKDRKQAGCDDAYVKVKVPAKPPVTPEPKPPVTPEPETPVQPEVPAEVPAELPQTGSVSALLNIVGAGATVFAGAAYIRSRR